MASGTSAAAPAALLLLPLLVLVLFAAATARADDGAIEFLPPRAPRRAGPPAPPTSSIIDGVVWAAEKKSSCPLIRVPYLVDACRSAPGLAGCAAQCVVVYHYRGGYCGKLPHGRPGDCYCTNCLGG